MSYLTAQDYQDRFGIDEYNQSLSTDNTISFEAALRDAVSIIHSYLLAIPNRVFTLPLIKVPDRIVEICADLTRYELNARKPTDEMTERRKQAMQFLSDLAEGKAGLDGITNVDNALIGISMTAHRRIFDDKNLRGFIS